jgi:hypothetical protein
VKNKRRVIAKRPLEKDNITGEKSKNGKKSFGTD